MQHISHELFLLTAELAQSKSRASIPEFLVSRLNELFSEVDFVWREQSTSGDGACLDVSTSGKRYGCVACTGELDEGTLVLLKKAARMAAVFMERLEQGEKLKNRKKQLKSLVDKKTRALREQEAKYRELIEKQGEGIINTDEKENVTFSNPAGDQIFGVPRGTLVGRSLREFLPISEFRKAQEESTKRSLGEKSVYEIRILRPDEERRTLQVTANPRYDSRGRYAGAFGIVRDITPQRQAEEAVRENLARFRALVDNLQMGVMVENPEGKIIHVNQKFCDLFHFPSPGSLEGEACEAAASRASGLFKDPGAFLEGIRRILSARQIVTNEELSLKDGSTLARDHVPIVIGQSFYGNMWIYRDVTRRKKVEQDLEYWVDFERLIIEISNNFIKLPLEETDQGIDEALRRIGEFAGVDRSYIFQLTPDGQYINNTHEWSASGIEPQIDHLQQLPVADYGWWMDKLNRREPIFIENVHDLPEEAQELKRSLLQQEIHALAAVPMIYKHSVMGYLGFDWVNREMHWSDEVINLLNIMGDVFTNAMMQQKAERELVKAKEKAEESDRLKSSFLANMSHEIRTPMNGIMGFAQLLKDSQLTESQKEQYIRIMYNSSRQLLRIVNDVLDISKIETGQYQVHNEPFSLNDLMVELFTEFTSQAEYQDVHLYIYKAFPDEAAHIFSDRTKLRQILFNLLSNAYKFTRRGTIEFGYYSNESRLRFYVQDTGIGIPRDRLDQIFDRFNRGETPASAQYGGTGLGLSISRGLVELMGGTIGVQSEEGQGSVFYFDIPHEPVPYHNRSLEVNGSEPLHSNADKRDILIVEDDEINAIFLSELLRDLGMEEQYYHIHHVYKGQDAVDFCREHPGLELVLMDIKLPDIDGLKATQMIKEETPQMHIVAQTAHALNSERSRAIEGGFDDYISKPIDRQELSGILKKYLEW